MARADGTDRTQGRDVARPGRESAVRNDRDVATGSSRRHIVKDLVDHDKEGSIDITFVAEEAGDIPMTPERTLEHGRLRRSRSRRWYPDLLYALTHKRYPQARAARLWDAIVAHRDELHSRLGRNPGVAVAALDYLTNLAEAIDRPTIIPELKLAAVADVAMRDAMTGLYDHTTLHVRLRDELRRARRYPECVSVVMLDVDDFKLFNDQYGHQAGDTILRKLASVLFVETRGVDLPARYGGEEFAVVLPSTDHAAALSFAERLRTRIARELSDAGVTVSLGVATFPEHALESTELIGQADAALYWSKRSGRNRTSSCVQARDDSAHRLPGDVRRLAD